MEISKGILAWHFLRNTQDGEGKLRTGEKAPPDGEWLEWDGPLVMCQSGLHASRELGQALSYAPGSILCLVELDGTIVDDTKSFYNDKLVASRRKIVWRMDVRDELARFAWANLSEVSHHLIQADPEGKVASCLAMTPWFEKRRVGFVTEEMEDHYYNLFAEYGIIWNTDIPDSTPLAQANRCLVAYLTAYSEVTAARSTRLYTTTCMAYESVPRKTYVSSDDWDRAFDMAHAARNHVLEQLVFAKAKKLALP